MPKSGRHKDPYLMEVSHSVYIVVRQRRLNCLMNLYRTLLNCSTLRNLQLVIIRRAFRVHQKLISYLVLHSSAVVLGGEKKWPIVHDFLLLRTWRVSVPYSPATITSFTQHKVLGSCAINHKWTSISNKRGGKVKSRCGVGFCSRVRRRQWRLIKVSHLMFRTRSAWIKTIRYS